MNAIQAAIELRDRAVQVAINFAGRAILESDGTYDLLITVVQDAMREWAKAAIEEEREECAKILDNQAEYYRKMWQNSGPDSAAFHQTAAKIAAHLAREVRARSANPP